MLGNGNEAPLAIEGESANAARMALAMSIGFLMVLPNVNRRPSMSAAAQASTSPTEATSKAQPSSASIRSTGSAGLASTA